MDTYTRTDTRFTHVRHLYMYIALARTPLMRTLEWLYIYIFMYIHIYIYNIIYLYYMALLNTTLTATASQHAKSSQRLQLGLSSQPRGIELELLTSTQSESLRSALSTNFQDKLKKGQQEHQFDSVRPTNNTQLTNMYDKSSTDMFRGFQFGSNKATKMEWEESEKKPKTSHQKKHKHCLIVYC